MPFLNQYEIKFRKLKLFMIFYLLSKNPIGDYSLFRKIKKLQSRQNSLYLTLIIRIKLK